MLLTIDGSFLSLSPGTRVWLGGHDLDARRAVHVCLNGTVHPSSGPIAVGIITPLSVDEAAYFAGKLVNRIEQNGRILVVWSRPDDGTDTASAELIRELDEAMHAAGFTSEGPGTFSDPFCLVAYRLHRTRME